MTIKKLVCIECPKGCNLTVDIENCKVTRVIGAKCPKGIGYAVTETEDPSRIFTSTVPTKGLGIKLVSVRTDKPIPKRELLRAAAESRKVCLDKGVKVGDVIVANFMGLGVNLVATRQVS